jgi:hypothetical protein
MAGGSAASSRHIWYSDVPGGVLRTHGSSLLPLPLKFPIDRLPVLSVVLVP